VPTPRLRATSDCAAREESASARRWRHSTPPAGSATPSTGRRSPRSARKYGGLEAPEPHARNPVKLHGLALHLDAAHR